jgi:hypothetical protein
MKVFLDDERFPSFLGDRYGLHIVESEWFIARTYKEFCDIISNYISEIDFISFDHDLQDFNENKEYTGATCATFLVNYVCDNNHKLPQWMVHSMNPVGTANITSIIKTYERITNI